MDKVWNTKYIDPSRILNIARGDKQRIMKYLLQFQELVPPRIEVLKSNLKEGDRKKTRQILHQMSPQLQFFGIAGIVTPIRRLEHEYMTMPMNELVGLVNDILEKLKHACSEVDEIISDFNNRTNSE